MKQVIFFKFALYLIAVLALLVIKTANVNSFELNNLDADVDVDDGNSDSFQISSDSMKLNDEAKFNSLNSMLDIYIKPK
jgi:hypothetical protein